MAGSDVEAMLAAVAHRRQLILALTPLRQRLHDQLNALAPSLSAPAGHGRALLLDTPTGHAVLACAAAFAGRAPTVRSLKARAARLARDLDRFQALRDDVQPPPP